MESENRDYADVLRSFCSEYQMGLVEFIVAQADGLHPQDKAEMDKYLDSHSGPVQEDPRDAFLALVAAYVETAFGIGFAIGHSAQVPAIRPMVEAFIEKLKRDGMNPEPEIPDFCFEESTITPGNA